MNSMTGFGQARVSLPDFEVSVDVRTLNNRHLDVVLRFPRELAALEPEIRSRLRRKLARGRVEVYVNLAVHSSNQYELNEPLVSNYRKIAEHALGMGIGGELSLSTLLLLPGVLSPRTIDPSAAGLREGVEQAVDDAVESVLEAREKEGAKLEAELIHRLEALEEVLAQIEPLAEGITEHYRQKLTERVSRLGPRERVEESRLAQEVLLYAEKADISEELTRLGSHIIRFREVLGSSKRRIGKNLDFLCQEMNREMNTIVSKSFVAAVSDIGVEGKVVIEKIREQVQNVE